ncbi:MAG: hypothetical protein LC116_11660 [Bacteroidetes bacterium]|nr:hypothetical protein [Bacteroidota bacterium]
MFSQHSAIPTRLFLPDSKHPVNVLAVCPHSTRFLNPLSFIHSLTQTALHETVSIRQTQAIPVGLLSQQGGVQFLLFPSAVILKIPPIEKTNTKVIQKIKRNIKNLPSRLLFMRFA